jgi:hypothetical protein
MYGINGLVWFWAKDISIWDIERLLSKGLNIFYEKGPFYCGPVIIA